MNLCWDKCCYRSLQTNPNLSVIFSFCQWCRTIKTSYYSIASVWFYRGKLSKDDDWITISLFLTWTGSMEPVFKAITQLWNECDLTSLSLFCDCEKQSMAWYGKSNYVRYVSGTDADKARKNKIDFAVAGYLNTSFHTKMNQMGIECIPLQLYSRDFWFVKSINPENSS